MTTALLVVGGYLLGSMPWGYWLVRLVKRDDIRRHGSGNIGGTNVWRVYGWRLGLPVVVLDTLKGFVPAFLGALLVSDLVGVLAGGAAMIGHGRPLFLRFQRGGKMVATCGGAFLGVAPLMALSVRSSGSPSSFSSATPRWRRSRPRSRCRWRPCCWRRCGR
jgi:acyl phosphate:glycerol-3-phosphate acyltransferase